MRRNLALPLAALIGAASAVPVSVAAFSAPPSTPGTVATEPTSDTSDGPTPDQPTPDEPTPVTAEDRYGMVRYDVVARRWAVHASPLFESDGLTGASCSLSTGVLTVTFAPLRTIGTFTVDEDDAYAGRYAAGAAANGDSLSITFRKPSTGAVVSCDAAELRIPNSSLQVFVRGNPHLATTWPTRPVPPTRPTPRPPTTQPSPTSRPPSPPVPVPPTTEPVDPPTAPTAPPPVPTRPADPGLSR